MLPIVIGLQQTISEVSENVSKKYRRDGLMSLFRAGVTIPLHTVGKPITYPAVEYLCDNTFGILTQSDLRNGGTTSKCHEFGAPETVHIDDPIVLESVPQELSQVCGQRSLEQPFVSEVQNASLVGKTAIGVTASSNIILETCISRRDILDRDLAKHPETIFRLLRHKRRSNQPDTTDFGNVCSLVNLYTGYYHWVQNSLTRLEGVEHYTKKTGNQPKLLIRKDPPSWLIESLELLGYSSDQWIEWDRSQADINQLIVPSMRRRESLRTRRKKTKSDDLTYKDVSANSYRWLRSRALENLDCDRTFPSMVLISREDAHSRRIQNKEAVLELLQPLGFEQFVLSDLSFQEQVKLFSEADIVVAPHGAGLINMIFADKTVVVELFPEWVKPTFFLLASNLGHDYGCIKCQQENRDIVVDLDSLEKLINKVYH